MVDIIPEDDESREKTTPETDEVNELMENTNFLISFVSSHPNTLFSEDGFLYSIRKGVDERKGLLEIIDKVMGNGYLIEDFQSDLIRDYLMDPGSFDSKTNSIRIGKSIKKVDMEELRKQSNALIREKNDAVYEYVPNRPFKGDIDEFLSLLWNNNIRAGIQMESAWDAMREKGNEKKKFVVAKQIDAVPSKDADIKPMTQILRSTKIKAASDTSNADLKEYESTFPEVTEEKGIGFKLIRKEPMQVGTEGIAINGTILEVTIPKDKDLGMLLGTGVSIIKEGDIEFIIADRFGFVSFDKKTKRVSITDEIINQDAIGPTTGNLEIHAEKFIQQANIDNGYRIVCNDFSMPNGLMSGTVHSRNGNVSIAQTVTEGGRVICQEGNVTIGNRVLGGMVEAFGGTINIPYAESSVIIGHEIIIEKAVNCVLIGDIINVTKSAGSSFFGKDIHIQNVDFTDYISYKDEEGNTKKKFVETHDHDIKIVIYVHDNLRARKTVKIIQHIDDEIIFLAGEIHRLHKELLAEGWEQKKGHIRDCLKGQGDFTEEEKRIWEKFSLYKNHEKRKKEREETLEELITENPQIEDILEYLESDNTEHTGLVIDSIGYSPRMLKEFEERKQKNLPAVCFDLGVEFYSAHDIPCHLREMTAWPTAAKRYFIDIANQRALGMITRQDPRTYPFHSERSTEGTLSIGYEEMKDHIQERKTAIKASPMRESNEIIPRAEKRLPISSPALISSLKTEIGTPPGMIKIPVTIDDRYEAFIQDFSGGGVCLIFDMKQKHTPIFENYEELDIEFTVNKVTHKQILIITSIAELDNDVLRVGGYYLNLSEDLSNALYRSKNFLEMKIRDMLQKQ